MSGPLPPPQHQGAWCQPRSTFLPSQTAEPHQGNAWASNAGVLGGSGPLAASLLPLRQQRGLSTLLAHLPLGFALLHFYFGGISPYPLRSLVW